MNNLLKVSVVVCTYSHERFFDTIETIESLVKQSYQNIEIILIIDRNVNLFTDFSKNDYLNSLGNLKMGISNLPGLSNARNKGVELSSGEIIAFIDDDAIADRNWIQSLIDCYDNPNIIGVGGPMRPLWIAGPAMWIPEEYYWTIGCSYKSQKNILHHVRSNFGSNMSFKSEIFEKVGNFNDKFGLIGNKMRTGEETEFSIRALNFIKNSKIIYNPKSVVYHKIYQLRKSWTFLIKRCYSYGYAIARIRNSNNKRRISESTESNFLEYLFTVSYLERIKDLIYLKSVMLTIIQIFSLSLLTVSVLIGFIFGKIAVCRSFIFRSFWNQFSPKDLKH